jgi:hypothetical protein
MSTVKVTPAPTDPLELLEPLVELPWVLPDPELLDLLELWLFEPPLAELADGDPLEEEEEDEEEAEPELPLELEEPEEALPLELELEALEEAPAVPELREAAPVPGWIVPEVGQAAQPRRRHQAIEFFMGRGYH